MLKIMKFGGSSVATAENIKKVASILLPCAEKEQIVVVVSALRGVTDQLVECAHLAKSGQNHYKEIYEHLVSRHRSLLQDLIGEQDIDATKKVTKLLHDLYKILHSIQYLHDDNLNVVDLTASFGEQLSAVIIASYLNLKSPARFVDARQFIITNNFFTKANVLYDKSCKAICNYFEKFFETEEEFTIPVVTGFIGMTEDNHVTTIGRDGSNYTAAILGSALNAKSIEIWSDVDGVYSADPKLIPDGIAHQYLSYSEAEELSNYRAKVVRQAVIPQIVTKHIPIFIKNTFHPAATGTQISLQTKHRSIKNISVVHELVIVTVTILAFDQINNSHLTERIFRILSLAHIPFSLITQTSSIHDICILMSEADLKEAERLIDIEFLYEFQQNLLILKKIRNQSVIALIGHGIKQALGSFGKILISLEENSITTNGFVHYTGECNISLIVNAYKSHNALKIIHNCIFGKQKTSE